MADNDDKLKSIYSQNYSDLQVDKKDNPNIKDKKNSPKSYNVIVPIAIVILLLIVGIYALSAYSKPAATPNTNSFVYKQLSQKNLPASNIYAISKNISSTINATNEINASYTGNLTLVAKLGNFPYDFALPLNVSFKKYGNDSILSFGVNTNSLGVGLLSGIVSGNGNLAFAYAKINGSDYYCRRIEENFTVNQSFVGKEVCTKVNSVSTNPINSSITKQFLGNIDNKIQFYNNTVNISKCNNMQGYIFTTNFKLKNISNSKFGTTLGNSSVITGLMSTCLVPSKSNMPAFINLNATILGSSKSPILSLVNNLSFGILLNLNASKLSNNMTKSEVDKLPGELVNASELNIAPSAHNSSDMNLNISVLSSINNGTNSTAGDNITFVTSALSHRYYLSKYLSGQVQIESASGNSGFVHVTLTGSNGKVYFSNGTNNWCMGDPDINTISLPPMQYNLTISVGRGGGECGNAEVVISKQ